MGKVLFNSNSWEVAAGYVGVPGFFFLTIISRDGVLEYNSALTDDHVTSSIRTAKKHFRGEFDKRGIAPPHGFWALLNQTKSQPLEPTLHDGKKWKRRKASK